MVLPRPTVRPRVTSPLSSSCIPRRSAASRSYTHADWSTGDGQASQILLRVPSPIPPPLKQIANLSSRLAKMVARATWLQIDYRSDSANVNNFTYKIVIIVAEATSLDIRYATVVYEPTRVKLQGQHTQVLKANLDKYLQLEIWLSTQNTVMKNVAARGRKHPPHSILLAQIHPPRLDIISEPSCPTWHSLTASMYEEFLLNDKLIRKGSFDPSAALRLHYHSLLRLLRGVQDREEVLARHASIQPSATWASRPSYSPPPSTPPL